MPTKGVNMGLFADIRKFLKIINEGATLSKFSLHLERIRKGADFLLGRLEHIAARPGKPYDALDDAEKAKYNEMAKSITEASLVLRELAGDEKGEVLGVVSANMIISRHAWVSITTILKSMDEYIMKFLKSYETPDKFKVGLQYIINGVEEARNKRDELIRDMKRDDRTAYDWLMQNMR